MNTTLEKPTEENGDLAVDHKVKLKKNNIWLREVWDWAYSVAFAIIFVLIIQQYILLPTIVQGDSMKSTMVNGERFIANRVIYYFTDPKPGEIITFHASATQDYVKRVIATAGQTVQITNNQLYVDGKPIEENYLNPMKQSSSKKDHVEIMSDYGPYKVPVGHIFVMGDNRLNSFDSREFGAISIDKVIGRVDFVFWPFKSIRAM